MKTHLTTEEAKTVLRALYHGHPNDKAAAIRIMEAEDVKRGELPALPQPNCSYADHSYPAYNKHAMKAYGEACARAALSAPAAPSEQAELEQLRAEKAAVEPMPRLPATPEEVVAFIGSHFDHHMDDGPLEFQRFQLSVHDLLSAFRDWEPAEQEPVAWKTSMGLYPCRDAIPARELTPLENPVPLYASPQAPVAASPKLTEALTSLLKEATEGDGKEFGHITAAFVDGKVREALAALDGSAPVAAVQGWISVKDRLPEVGQGVIAYRPTAEQTQDPTITITFYTNREQESWQGVKHQFDCLCHPSHWMPLPPVPDA